ncbi:hypothetical protein IJH15_00635 [Candidatus Saccharibacteria bacterium]|nr:hypothetical protein [Candidatus Saccharibacteria bacterium]MBQ6313403.1 hypothetical protein [Candidatus Saccharibacteria bacterium]
MRLDTRFIKLRKTILAYFAVVCGAVCLVAAIVFGVHIHTDNAAALSEEQLYKFAQNNILFYDPDSVSCVSSSICGSTAEEKYWSLLRRYFEPAQVAGIIGNMKHEGDFNPVSWEAGKVTNSSGQFVFDGGWDRLYNECNSGCRVGVGALGITSYLSDYLHFINQEAPDLLQYFQNPEKYGFNYIYKGSGYEHTGDQALEVIGEKDFNRLIELEIKFVMENSIGPDGFYTKAKMFDMDTFKSYASAYDAGVYWAKMYERCSTCHTEETQNLRGGDAQATYEKLKNFSCSSGAAGSGAVAPDVVDADVTLIGDSMSVYSENELREKLPNSFMTMVGSRHSTSGGVCSGDKGGLDTLQVLASGSGAVVAQSHNGECKSLSVDSSSLKKNVIWELGTNTNGANRGTIESVINIIGNRNLYLVTPFNANDGAKALTDGIAETYRDIAKSYQNVYIVDWNEAVRDNTSKYLDGSGYHPNSDGQKLLADLIASTIVSSGGDTNYSLCGSVSGGLNEKQIERLRDYYNGPEVDAAEWGLPNGKKNCVSFSLFFVQKFTSVDGTWTGHGKDLAHNLAMWKNLPEGNEPRPFAVFSTTDGVTMCGNDPPVLCGHTGIVVAVDGDDVTTVEASYQQSDAIIVHRTSDWFQNVMYSNIYTYLDSILDNEELLKVVGR